VKDHVSRNGAKVRRGRPPRDEPDLEAQRTYARVHCPDLLRRLEELEHAQGILDEQEVVDTAWVVQARIEIAREVYWELYQELGEVDWRNIL
jgi:hypothetical protein